MRGPSCDPDNRPQVASWLERLSNDYGHAQAYFFGTQNDGDAWLVAEAGRITRRGTPLPAMPDE